jgi:hypothetical protein
MPCGRVSHKLLLSLRYWKLGRAELRVLGREWAQCGRMVQKRVGRTDAISTRHLHGECREGLVDFM